MTSPTWATRNARAKERAAKAASKVRRDSTRCPDCSGGGYELTIAGRVIGVCGMCGGAGALCANFADPVLCKRQPDGVFVPEAGCPIHDPDVYGVKK